MDPKLGNLVYVPNRHGNTTIKYKSGEVDEFHDKPSTNSTLVQNGHYLRMFTWSPI